MDGEDATGGWGGVVETGEWAGWRISSSDPFEMHAGPFYMKREPDGGAVCAFRAEPKHMNGGEFMHGGCLMTFADYAIFAIAGSALDGGGSVTASMNCEFIDAARVGEMIESRGEVVRAGGSLVFIRGQVTTGGRTLLNYSAIIKKVRRKG
ncbi:MAG: PaaI family thioesterase [Proteobacteria bacterium]|nr:PaaI family thioesterase [Pseudomonadota bacterium]